VPVFWAAEIAAARDERWMEPVLHALTEPVYVSVDVDGFDPACMPGTGTPEPGGLSWYQVTHLLQRVFAERRVVAADIVEVAPVAGSAITEFAAARLAVKLLLYHRHGRHIPLRRT